MKSQLCLGAPLECDTFLRRMKGGSRSVLVRASDSNLYVIKSGENPQGPNLPFNEALGSILAGMLGLPMPAWQAVRVSARFIENVSDQWVGERIEIPQPGVYFGSRLIASSPDRHVFQMIPHSWVTKVREPGLFGRMLLLDLWAHNLDRRQAMFVRSRRDDPLDAVFFDNGHMFGGPSGNEVLQNCAKCLYYDKGIYTESAFEDDQISFAVEWIEGLNVGALRSICERVPACWASERRVKDAITLLMEGRASLERKFRDAIRMLRWLQSRSLDETRDERDLRVYSLKP